MRAAAHTDRNLANPENPQNGWDDLDGDGVFTEGEPPLPQDPHPILGDLEVRKAIAYSIDYTGIVNKVAFGQGAPTAANVLPAVEWAYDDSIEPYFQDLELAAQLLADAGWVAGSATNDAGIPILEKDGVPMSMSLMTNAGNEVRENMAIIMKDVLDQLGFDIELQIIEFGTVVQNLLGQSYDILIIGFTGLGNDPDGGSTSLFSYINDEVGAGFNFVSYYSEEAQNAIDMGKTVPGCSEEERAPYYATIQERIHDDIPMNFFYIPLQARAWNTQLNGIDPNTWDLRYNIQDWYLTP